MFNGQPPHKHQGPARLQRTGQRQPQCLAVLCMDHGNDRRHVLPDTAASVPGSQPQKSWPVLTKAPHQSRGHFGQLSARPAARQLRRAFHAAYQTMRRRHECPGLLQTCFPASGPDPKHLAFTVPYMYGRNQPRRVIPILACSMGGTGPRA